VTVLAPPLLTWYQFGEPTPNHNECCGQNAVASGLVAGGHLPASAQAPLTVDAWMRAQGYPGLSTGGTQTSWLQDALAHFAGARGVDRGDDLAGIGAVLDAGRYPIVLVGSDDLGHPVPAAQAITGHWVICYGLDGSGYYIANSGSGALEHYAPAYFSAAYRATTLDTGITPQDMGDQPLTDAEKTDLATCIAVAIRDIYLDRDSTLPDVNATAARMVAIGFSKGMWEVTGSQEATSKPNVMGAIAVLSQRITALQTQVTAKLGGRLGAVELDAQEVLAELAALQRDVTALVGG
jgi:hypothetical protein